MPDLVIDQAAVSMKCNPNGMRTATIFVVVKNEGAIAADLSTIPFATVVDVEWWFTAGSGFLASKSVSDGMKSGAVGGPKLLEPNGSFQTMFTISGIPTVADAATLNQSHPYASYGFKVTADPLKMVAEAIEDNNTKMVYVQWNHCT